jgi:hypothetical protein
MCRRRSRASNAHAEATGNLQLSVQAPKGAARILAVGVCALPVRLPRRLWSRSLGLWGDRHGTPGSRRRNRRFVTGFHLPVLLRTWRRADWPAISRYHRPAGARRGRVEDISEYSRNPCARQPGGVGSIWSASRIRALIASLCFAWVCRNSTVSTKRSVP